MASVTATTIAVRRRAADHSVRLIDGSAYRVGIGNATGTRAWLENRNHYPAEGLCSYPGCSQVARCDELGHDWHHTGRVAGDAVRPGTDVATLELEAQRMIRPPDCPQLVAAVRWRITTCRLRAGDHLTAAGLALERWSTMSAAAEALQVLAEAGLLESLPDGAYAVLPPAPGAQFVADEHAWRQLADFLAERIKRGEFTGKLPIDAALMKQYRVGRGTVRRARLELMERGLVRYWRGHGTLIN